MAEKDKLTGYDDLLGQVKTLMEESVYHVDSVDHQRLLIYWEVGQLLNGRIKNQKARGYAQGVVTRLGTDLQLSKRFIYRTRALHRSFPDLDEEQDGTEKLTWSHYSKL